MRQFLLLRQFVWEFLGQTRPVSYTHLVEVEDVEAEDGTITVYTEPTDLHKALEALRANGQEEFQVTELEMIPQTEVTLEGEDLEVFEGLIDALEADDDVQKVYHNVADM